MERRKIVNERVGVAGGGKEEIEFYGQESGGARSPLKKPSVSLWRIHRTS